MSRPRLRQRVPEVAEAACRVFVEKGYRRAHVSDVAAALGLSQGAVYGYVESKEALFQLAMTFAIGKEALDRVELPLATPGPGQLLRPLRMWDSTVSFPILLGALDRPKPDNVRDEFGAVIDELYALLQRNRLLLSLIEGSARDLPELSELYYESLRGDQVSNLGNYVAMRVEADQFHSVPDVAIATRFIIESVAWFAWHRMDDREGAAMDAGAAQDTLRQLLVDAFAADGREPGTNT